MAEINIYGTLNAATGEGIIAKSGQVKYKDTTVEAHLDSHSMPDIDENTLTIDNNTLKVNTVDDAEEDNTKPITASGVYTILGNINALLNTI